jgi:hypothetical protein
MKRMATLPDCSACEQSGRTGELGMSFAVGNGDRQTRTGHALQEDRRRLLHLHHRHPRLELLGAVAHEVRPAFATRDQLVQVGHHLAAIAHAEGKAVLALEEGLKALTGAGIEQHRLGPALTGAQHIAVGEAAAGHQPLELRQVQRAR